MHVYCTDDGDSRLLFEMFKMNIRLIKFLLVITVVIAIKDTGLLFDLHLLSPGEQDSEIAFLYGECLRIAGFMCK